MSLKRNKLSFSVFFCVRVSFHNLVTLELVLQTRLDLSTEIVCFPNAEIKGVCHHHLALCTFLTEILIFFIIDPKPNISLKKQKRKRLQNYKCIQLKTRIYHLNYYTTSNSKINCFQYSNTLLLRKTALHLSDILHRSFQWILYKLIKLVFKSRMI